MSKNSRHAWIEINQRAFINNIASYKRILEPGSALSAVLKSNAYGHGLFEMGQICQVQDALDWICTFFMDEAIQLRQMGVTKPILMLAGPDATLAETQAYGLSLVIHSRDQLRLLTEQSYNLRGPIQIHLKVDTGLSRLGFSPDEVLSVVEEITTRYPYLSIQGLMTHFAQSGASDVTYTLAQEQKLLGVIEQLVHAGVYIPLIHSSNSAATIRFGHMHQSMVRVGGGLYGLKWEPPVLQAAAPEFRLEQILSLHTRLISVRTVQVGTSVGYDRMYRADESHRVGVIPVGYADGIGLRRPHGAQVCIDGVIVPAVGSLSMNAMILDLRKVPQAVVGTQVTLIGTTPGIRAIDIAQRCGAVPYEITTNLNPKLPRIITEQEIGTQQSLGSLRI